MNRGTTRSKATLGRRAYLELRERILRGDFAPGGRLSFRMLAKLLGMSLAPVGEALRELSRDGLVDMEPGWGARVRTIDEQAARGAWILRMAIECEAARQCALSVGESELVELANLASELDRFLAEPMDPLGIRERDLGFHSRVSEIASPRLREALVANQWVLALAKVDDVTRIGGDSIRVSHRNIVEAIATRDPELAAKTMREHLSIAIDIPPASWESSVNSGPC